VPPRRGWGALACDPAAYAAGYSLTCLRDFAVGEKCGLARALRDIFAEGPLTGFSITLLEKLGYRIQRSPGRYEVVGEPD